MTFKKQRRKRCRFTGVLLFRFMKRFFFCLLMVIAGTANAQPASYKLQPGDLLFQDIDCGGLCDAIEAVTQGIDGRHFSHLGLVVFQHDSAFVVEAIGKDVHLTPAEKFIHRQADSTGKPKIVISRLKQEYRYLNEKAIRFALKQLHTPYDDEFLYNNGKYYCSELIYDAYKYANGNRPFFQLFPMTFKDPATGETFPAWTDYYLKLKHPIPEGQPGCNPGGISTSDKIEIVTALY
jgi:hypothetical protein